MSGRSNNPAWQSLWRSSATGVNVFEAGWARENVRREGHGYMHDL